LQKPAGYRDNNFNLLRFIAATLVVFGHSYPLSGNPVGELSVIGSLDITRIAVDIFFVISGFLVTGSLFARKNVIVFCQSRFLRIFPALAVVLLLTVFVLGPCFTSLPLPEYFRHPDTWRYLVTNGLFYDTQFTLPGVFEQLVYPNDVNSSLWTLPYEVKMYLILAVLGCLSYAGPRWLPEKQLANLVMLMAVSATACLIYTILLPRKSVEADTMDNLRFMSLFFIGGAMHIWRDKLRLNAAIVIIMLALIILLQQKIIQPPLIKPYKAFLISYSLFIAYIVIYLACIPAGFIRRFNQWGDYSYGIYIYAFPVQQTVSALHGASSPLLLFAMAFPVTLLFAIASWHWIEQPLLQYKKNPAN
jgi:peptidoglycan/LPS O-acetylase OafA/YrhL